MHEFLLQAHNLEVLIQVMRGEGYEVLGPVVRDGAIAYGEISTCSDLPQGWSDTQEKGYYRIKQEGTGAYFGYAVGPTSWKQFLQLPRRKLWHAEKTDDAVEIVEVMDHVPARAFLGVRSCELHAIEIQDRVFKGSGYRDESYARRRDNTLLIGINCTAPAATCFCTAMDTGPGITSPTDLTMTEVLSGDEHFFLIQSGSEQGNRILQQLPLEPATEKQREQGNASVQAAAKKMAQGPRQFESSDVKELLYRNYESPVWDQVADRCLSCANCTMACPTCFCSTVEDFTDLTGNHAERWEYWDSCFTRDHSYITGGSVRADTSARYRQWLTHKLATWHDQFGSSGCVGCGRCITWCPVGIDITEEVQKIREQDQT